MTVNEILALIKPELAQIEEALFRNIRSDVPLINEVVSYLLSSGGKRMRPAFMVLSAKLCEYWSADVTALSAVIEYIHTATLLHDDIVDGAKYRRNKPSANSIYGNDIAVLCGDYLYSRAYMLLSECGDKNIQKLLSATAMAMSEGEVVQLLKTADINISMSAYFKIIKSKTAVLFSSSCETVARLAGLADNKRDALASFGMNLGMAFQMSDDLLDYFGDTAKTGKTIGTDLNERKLTLPVILLIKEACDEERNNLAEIFKSSERDGSELSYVIDIMKKYSILEKSDTLVSEYITKAITALDIFPDSKYRCAMTALAGAMINRQK